MHTSYERQRPGAGKVPELNFFGLELSPLRLKYVILSNQLVRITDVIAPLMNNINPVINIAQFGSLN